MKQGYNNTWGDTYGFGSGGNTVFDQQDDWDLGETRQFDKAIKSLESQSKSLEKKIEENSLKTEKLRYHRLALQAGFREMIHTHKIDMTADEFYKQMDEDIKSLKQGVKMDNLSPSVL